MSPVSTQSAVLRPATADSNTQTRVEVSHGDRKSNRGVAWSEYDHQEGEWLVYWHGGGIHRSGNVGDYRAGSGGFGGNHSRGLAADLRWCSAFGCGVQWRWSGARTLADIDRSGVYRGRRLFFDAPVVGAWNADAVLDFDYPGRSGVRNHRLFPDARRKRVRLAPGKCARHAAPGRADLVPLAVEFGVGHRNTGRCELADDRIFAADVWSGRAKSGKPRGRLANAVPTSTQNC